MTIDNFENIVSLLCTITGLLYCVFKYVESPKFGYRLLLIYFLASFLSEYYWTIYSLTMGSYPNVSEFTAYLGWNIGYLILLIASYYIRPDEAKNTLHPLVFLPALVNVPQFLLYIQYGGILNNIWQVGTTTLTMIFCLQSIIYFYKGKTTTTEFPLFSVLVLIYLVLQYIMWTVSCYSWDGELSNPYLYCSILGAVTSIFFTYGVLRFYKIKDHGILTGSASELRFQVLVQTIISLVIIGICIIGLFIAFWVKKSLTNQNGVFKNEEQLIVCLFVISAVLIFLVLLLLNYFTTRYHSMIRSKKIINDLKRSKFSFYFTIIVTLTLMAFAVVYNNIGLYSASVISVYEDGDEAIKSTATELENYMTVASTTMRVAADSVSLMDKNGSSLEDIRNYLVDQTKIQAEQFDENFTGLYAYMNGEYLDGLMWVPPEGYDPTSRDWYKAVVEGQGETVIVPPYVDAQTGAVVITIGKNISYGESLPEGQLPNVVCLDVMVNHIEEIAKSVSIAGKGYGMVVNTDGFIVAHQDVSINGRNLKELYDHELLDTVLATRQGRTTAKIDGKECTLFIYPVMNQWYTIIVISNDELWDNTYSQLAVNIMVSVITFCLITFFYYIGYKNEILYGKKVEEMNIQVVSALATAIDAKDTYTNGHSSRVAEYAKMIAERAGLSQAEQDDIYMMGLLHDVGKIGIPDEVINKPSRLTAEEYKVIQRHPVIGSGILKSIKENPKLATGARWHHERYGGGGYPDGISGEDIPVEARIIAVADAYDAMTSRRSYRGIMPQEKVRSEIKLGMGTQFDPRFARVMLQMIDEDKSYTMREK
ncbi:hypothetical protein BXO88_02215 [Oribacterium sp. C9]|uniref:HD domain-containing phosphohydrolase n=1 Tax=Oribacterium sp. C9 TaxID=1943579 RepID=UPI00098F6CB6|nr:HD domain-containing phosphohydrolase [Oribacterium sp. C9]OON88009.1 hypothetical protein BXO88_02215 [Oribacterium sp. C9]